MLDQIQQEMQQELKPFQGNQNKSKTFFGKPLNTSFADTSSVIPGQRLVR